MKALISLAVVLAVAAASLAYLGSVGVIDIEGTVNVPGSREAVSVSPKVIEVSLYISNSSGEVVEEGVGVLRAEEEAEMIFKPVTEEVSGDLTLSLSGEVLLTSSTRKYTIPMPCLMTVNTACYRVMMVIPGYDAPLKVLPGEYSISLKLRWDSARGRGHFKLKILVIAGSGEEAYILPFTSERVDTTGWITAEGSTRTYLLLIEKQVVKACGGYGEVRALAWLFSPNEIKKANYQFKLVDKYSGEVVAELELPAHKVGAYYEALVLIKARPGSYILEVTYPSTGESKGVTLSAELLVKE